MKKLFRYSKRYWLQIILAAVFSVTASISTVMVIDILKEIIDLISENVLQSMIYIIVIKIILVIILGAVSNYMVVALTGYIAAGLLHDLRNDAISALMNASPEYISKCNYGDLMERIIEEIEGLSGFMSGYFKDCLYVPIITIVYSVYLAILNVPLAVICLVPLVIMVPLNIKLLKPIKLRQFQYAKELGMTNNNVEEVFAGAEVIKSYNLQQKMMKRYEKALHKTFVTSNETDLAQYNLEPISRAIQEVPLALAICAGGIFVFNNAITVGVLIAYFSTIKKLIDPLSYSYQLIVRSQTALVSVSRVFDIIDVKPEEENKDCIVEKERCEIRFENVTFNYGAENVLENISFEVKPGEKVAFVGESGSGKSTIMKLISRIVTTENGKISLGGLDYNEYSPNEIRGKMAMISQDVILFPMSIADNIRIGNPEATDEKITKALELAGCKSFIDELPKGIGTVLSEQGNNLSGGQKQRLSIARAIIKNADILLLDEPTKALDAETEEHICKTIDELSHNHTIITVAHRLNTITGYDRIYVLDKGRIMEQGNHTELMNMNGKYKQLYQEFLIKNMEEEA